MKFKGRQYTTKKRPGMSTIVGGLIFVVLMVSAFSMFGATLQYQNDLTETSRIVAKADLEQRQEDFDLTSISQPAGEFLAVSLINDGQNAAEMFTMIMTNKSDAGEPTQVFEIPSNTSFLAPGNEVATDIVETLNINMTIPPAGNITNYDFKVISSLGTIKKLGVSCDGDTGICGPTTVPPGSGALSSVLFLDGPTAINTKTSTIVMFVSNTSDEQVNNVTPVKGWPAPPNCVGFWTFDDSTANQTLFTEEVTNCVVEPIASVNLGPYETTIFKWDATIGGDVGSTFEFCNSVTGEDPNFPPVIASSESCDSVEIIDPNDCDGCGPGGDGEEDILDERFITRPEIFITFPGPFGESTNGIPDRALWGANVVNPTDTDMYIHKVTITAFPPASNDNFDVVEPGGATGHLCYPQDYLPGNSTIPATTGNAAAKRATEAGFWSCPGSNTIMWKNYANPIFLPAQDTVPFMVKLTSAIPVNDQGESVLVDSTVYTTSGAFGKGDYQTSSYDNGLYANVFSTSDWQDPLNMTNFESSRSGILSGNEETFHVVLTDFDSDLDSYINAGTRVVINVPRAFTLVDTDMTESFGFNDVPNANATLADPSIVIHPDDTTQIIATLENDLGDSADEYAVLTFKATAPTVTQKKLMVMYILANGAGTNSVDSIVNSIGPTHEYILQVVP